MVKAMKRLHQLRKGAKIYESVGSYVGEVWKGSDADTDPVIFDHIDGAYSFCYLQSDKNMVVHISANAPMEKYKDGWKIADKDAEAVAHTTT